MGCCFKCCCCCCKGAACATIKVTKVLLAIFVPPYAIYQKKGCKSYHFWVSLFLTTSGLAPGSIHGVWVVCA